MVLQVLTSSCWRSSQGHLGLDGGHTNLVEALSPAQTVCLDPPPPPAPSSAAFVPLLVWTCFSWTQATVPLLFRKAALCPLVPQSLGSLACSELLVEVVFGAMIQPLF